ncbi:MAG TPA: VWA domain-containing protein, partial [Paludibacteraceae bacterium]|nr:VWA domain-containing protein [Paludibacteraceae bacterium]
MEFESPGYLYILLALIPIIVWYIWKRKKLTPSMQISSIESFVGVKKSYKYYILHLPFVLRIGAFALIIVALARPQSFDNWETKNVEGIDIVMALDISESMLAEDFKPNRLEAAKKVGANFVASRKNDNVGVVVFSGASYPLTPLTTDKVSVVSLMGGIDYKMMDANGTAIGLGLTS